MSIRACDVIGHLRMKQLMVESDHDAVFSDGRRLPVFIYARPNGETIYAVEVGASFFEPKLLPGFLRLEITPDVKVQREVEAAEAEALKAQEKPKDYAELVQRNQALTVQAHSERYASRMEQQGIVSNHPMTDANRREAAAIAARLRPNRNQQ